jgi:coenzyme F420-0:L-glutamate ligase/coenzyme F420-1:gamma-L-glutamate ligase
MGSKRITHKASKPAWGRTPRPSAKPTTAADVRVFPITIPGEIRPGDSLTEKLLQALNRPGLSPKKGDILIVKHKIVSKAEGQLISLEKIKPSASSRAWARRYKLDPRVTELALVESRRVIRRKRGVLITETRHGLICANSGVDVSNVNGGRHALLLPKDPDGSATRLHRELKKRLKLSIPVIITDSFGRPWREGLTEVAIGVAGMQALHDYRGEIDPDGYPLRVTIEAVADELACAAGLVCGKLARTPACIIRGFRYQPGRGRARDLIRPAATDLFR